VSHATVGLRKIRDFRPNSTYFEMMPDGATGTIEHYLKLAL